MYSVIVIGCGKIGAGMGRFSPVLEPWSHAGAFDEHARTQLVGLVDTDEAQLANGRIHFPHARCFSSAEEAVTAAKPDLVVVATSTSSHAPIVRKLVDLGIRNILCEKPLADSVEDAMDMVRLCEKHGVRLFVNHIRRFDPVAREAREMLPKIGEIGQIACHYSLGVKHNGVHLFDFLRFFAGEVREVIGIRNERTESKTSGVHDIDVDGLLFFESGARACVQVHDASDYSMFTLDVFGRNGVLHVRDLGFRFALRRVRESPDFTGYRELAPRPEWVSGEPRNWMRFMARHVVDVLDGKVQPYATGMDGVRALEISEALRTSAMGNGVRVAIPPRTPD